MTRKLPTTRPSPSQTSPDGQFVGRFVRLLKQDWQGVVVRAEKETRQAKRGGAPASGGWTRYRTIVTCSDIMRRYIREGLERDGELKLREEAHD